MVSSRHVSATRNEDIIIDFINDVQSEEENGKSCRAQKRVLRQYHTLYPWFNLHLVNHYKAKRKRAAEQHERANITAASNKKSRAGALGNFNSALDVARAGTPHQGQLNGGIPADITALESPDSDDSVAANASGDSNINIDSDSDSIRGRGSNVRTIIQKWKASDKGVSVCLGQQFINRARENRKNKGTHRDSDSDGDGDRKLAGTSLGGGGG
jgi:hypothetical protein